MTRLISTGILDKFDIDSLNSDSGYDTVLYLYKYIALIVPRETLAKYQFQGDESILQQALIHIDKEETDEISANKRAFKLFSDLALATINRNNENLTESIIEEISYYYKQVTGMKIQEDLNTFFQHIPAFMSAESPVGKFLLNAVGIKDTYDLYFNTTEQMRFFQDNTNDTNNKSISFDIVEKDHTIKSFTVPVTSTLCEEYRQFIQRENGRDR